jgi:membrane associated rhomboid family serine protease
MQRTYNKYSASPFIRHFHNNAVLQLIVALGAAFVIFHFTINVMRVMQFAPKEILDTVVAYSVLPPLADFKYKIWSVFSYGLFHMRMIGGQPQMGFWAMFSNMLWLYCFGSLVQMLIGHRHVIPMFFYAVILGGIGYMTAQLVPAWEVPEGFYLGGAQAGITGLAVAAYTVAPKYRFYLSDHFSIPMWAVAGIFAVLILLYTGFEPASLSMVVAGGLMGFLYITLLRRGFDLSDWLYRVFGKVNDSVVPKEDAYRRHSHKRSDVLNSAQQKLAADEQRVDEILDKINRKGYNSLSKEEKEILLRASKENE